MALKDSLISHWKLDETSGTRVDSHGSNDLTDNNTVGVATGKLGNAADFELSNSEFLSHVDSSELSVGDIDFTFALWVNLESTSDFAIASHYLTTGNQRSWQIVHSGNRFRFLVSSDGTSGAGLTQVTGDELGEPSTGVWYFLVCKHDAASNEISIKINDGTADTLAHSGGAINSTAAFVLGAVNSGGSSFYDGLIDSFSFWKRLTTDEEDTELYNSGNAFDYDSWDAASSVLLPSSSNLTGGVLGFSKRSNLLFQNADSLGVSVASKKEAVLDLTTVTPFANGLLASFIAYLDFGNVAGVPIDLAVSKASDLLAASAVIESVNVFNVNLIALNFADSTALVENITYSKSVGIATNFVGTIGVSFEFSKTIFLDYQDVLASSINLRSTKTGVLEPEIAGTDGVGIYSEILNFLDTGIVKVSATEFETFKTIDLENTQIVTSGVFVQKVTSHSLDFVDVLLVANPVNFSKKVYFTVANIVSDAVWVTFNKTIGLEFVSGVSADVLELSASKFFDLEFVSVVSNVRPISVLGEVIPIQFAVFANVRVFETEASVRIFETIAEYR